MADAHLKCIQLDVGVAMGKPLDQGLDGGLGTVAVTGHAVANLHDGGPVLRGEILVCGLGCFQIPSAPSCLVCPRPQTRENGGHIPMASS